MFRMFDTNGTFSYYIGENFPNMILKKYVSYV